MSRKDRRFSTRSKLLALFLGAALSASCTVPSEQRVPMPSQAVELTRPDLCRIYVFRSEQAMGSARRLIVYDQDREIGSLSGNEYLCWERPAGRTLLRAVYQGPKIDRGDKEDLRDFTAQAGTVQYLVVGLYTESTMEPLGDKRGAPELRPVSAEEGRALLERSRPAGHR